MKRISVPINAMFDTLVSLNVSLGQIDDIISLFEVVDAGHHDVLVMPALALNTDNSMSPQDVLITLFSFWSCAVSRADLGSAREQQGLGAIRSLYFVAENLGHTNIAAYIAVWWKNTVDLHGSASLELWA